jgi:hypothetical protein
MAGDVNKAVMETHEASGVVFVAAGPDFRD